MDTDFILIQKMKRGDEDAVEAFVRKYYPAILKYCRYHTPDMQNAADLTQETFARFFAALPRYQYRGKTANYLYVIAGNLCRDTWHRPKEIPMEQSSMLSDGWGDGTGRPGSRAGMPDSEAEPGPWRVAGCPMEAAENHLMVEQALGRLPEELREVIILYYFQDRKLREIAKILGIGLPLVKYRMRRAKEMLRDYIGEEDAR